MGLKEGYKIILEEDKQRIIKEIDACQTPLELLDVLTRETQSTMTEVHNNGYFVELISKKLKEK